MTDEPGPAVDRDVFGNAPPEGKRSWRHRRGEPRVFALLWTVYLMVVTSSTFVMAGMGGMVDREGYRPAARALMLVIMAGLVVMWPMVRLSQVRAAGSARSAIFKDLVIMLAPVQAVVWPQLWLAGWSVSAVAALAALMAAWTGLVGAVLMVAMRAGHPRRAGRWMGVLVGSWAVTGAVALALDRQEPLTGWLANPFLGAWRVTRYEAWRGLETGVGSMEWVWIAGLLALAAAGLLWGGRER